MEKKMNHTLYDAWILGQEAAMNGRSISANPYDQPELHAEWTRGWTVENEEEQEYRAAMDRQRARCY
jgi:ribosome modulation factor